MRNPALRMTPSVSISSFHQWLLADPASDTSACAIVIHDDGDGTADLLAPGVAAYLNEYDDNGEGRWLPATAELIGKIARDPSHCRLLGMRDAGPEAPSQCLRTLEAIARRGHVVLRAPVPHVANLDPDLTFHAGIGGVRPEDCHIVVNPERIHAKCLARVVGDVFLEWLHCRNRSGTPIKDIRQSMRGN